jgi:phospholipid/cholesterol/gamma-HCH transport system substrate-binding protein
VIKYRGAHLIRAGFIGGVLVVLTIAVGLQPKSLWSLATAIGYRALFSDASGLTTGNPVTVSGMKVGSISDISLNSGHALVKFTLNARIGLGSQTTAHIATGTLLGERELALESAGAGVMHPNAIIPLDRTTSPYTITDAVNELTTNVAGTDTASLNQSLDTLSSTLDQIGPQLGATFDGLARVSKALNERDRALGELLKQSADVTGILARRSQQINTLILNANDLVGVLSARRQAIVRLLANTSAVAVQLSGLVHDNEKQLAPTLDKLNSVIAVLEKNRDNIAKALPGLAKYESTNAEIVASGPYYTAYIPNISLPQVLQPFLDYLWGFRTFDTAPGRGPGYPSPMPRALLPWPYNGIPQGPH